MGYRQRRVVKKSAGDGIMSKNVKVVVPCPAGHVAVRGRAKDVQMQMRASEKDAAKVRGQWAAGTGIRA